MDLSSPTNLELLRMYAAVMEELRRRNVIRTANNPVADYTEWLVSDKLGLRLENSSQAGYDAIDHEGNRYQIKGRRVRRSQVSATLSAIRNLADQGFDWLIAVIFETDFSIRYAAKIPHGLVRDVAAYRAHINGHVLNLHPGILQREGVHDLTAELCA